PCEPGIELAVFLLEDCDARFRVGKFLLKLSMPVPILLRLYRILRFGSGKRGDDRREVHFCERARYRQAFAAFWRARAVESADRWKGDTMENVVGRGPQIAFATEQPRQVAEYALTLLPVGLTLDPSADCVTILARRQLHRNED